MPKIPRFNNCVSCPCSFLISDDYQCILCYLGEAYISAKCSICCSFSPQTRKQWELQQRKYLMEKARRHFSDPGHRDPSVFWPQSSSSTPPNRSSETRLLLINLKNRCLRFLMRGRGTLLTNTRTDPLPDLLLRKIILPQFLPNSVNSHTWFLKFLACLGFLILRIRLTGSKIQ